MDIDERIKILCIKTGVSKSEIGRRLNISPQAFNQKIKRGSITIDDLVNIAIVTQCKLECSFVLPGGETIKLK